MAAMPLTEDYLSMWTRLYANPPAPPDYDFGGTVTVFAGRRLFFFEHLGVRAAVTAENYSTAALAVKTMITVGND